MSSYVLSRSSRLYKFVFGREEGKLEGFPEPRGDKIPLGLFLGLLVAMLVMRPLASAMLLFMDALLKVMGFFVDGSYVRGSLLTGFKVIGINPWPKVYGRRVSPWILFAAALVVYQYCYIGAGDALQSLIGLVLITVIFFSIKPGDKSPGMVMVEAVAPTMDKKLYLAYHRRPKLLPALHLVD